MISRVCRRLSQLFMNFVMFMVDLGKMRRVLSRVLGRVLLSPALVMETEVQWLHMGGETRRKLVVGLGNPGMDGTRHNVGRAVVDALAVRLGAAGRWKSDRQLNSELNVCEVGGDRVVLLKPKLLMNLNGAAVAKAVSKFGVLPEDVLLVHDELDKPLGKIAVKLGGSARGHNGVRSCVDSLNTDVMRRLRVGIGRPSGKSPVDRYVLGRFSPDERKVLDLVLVQSVDQLLSLLRPEEGAVEQSRPEGGAVGTERTKKDRRTQEDKDTAVMET